MDEEDTWQVQTYGSQFLPTLVTGFLSLCKLQAGHLGTTYSLPATETIITLVSTTEIYTNL